MTYFEFYKKLPTLPDSVKAYYKGDKRYVDYKGETLICYSDWAGGFTNHDRLHIFFSLTDKIDRKIYYSHANAACFILESDILPMIEDWRKDAEKRLEEMRSRGELSYQQQPQSVPVGSGKSRPLLKMTIREKSTTSITHWIKNHKSSHSSFD